MIKIIILMICICQMSCSVKSTNDSTSILAQFDSCKVGIVGCKFSNLGSTSQFQEEELEAHIIQKMINNIKTKKHIIVLDRTKLDKVMEEYALSLSGLIENKVDEPTIAIHETDFLLTGLITGFSAKTIELLGDENMSESSSMFQGKVSYHLSLELINSTNGQVEWTFSEDIVNADYKLDKAEINLKTLVFNSLSDNIRKAIEQF